METYFLYFIHYNIVVSCSLFLSYMGHVKFRVGTKHTFCVFCVSARNPMDVKRTSFSCVAFNYGSISLCLNNTATKPLNCI